MLGTQHATPSRERNDRFPTPLPFASVVANDSFGSRAALLTGYRAYDLHQEWVRPLSPGQLLQSRPRYIRVCKEWLFYNDGFEESRYHVANTPTWGVNRGLSASGQKSEMQLCLRPHEAPFLRIGALPTIVDFANDLLLSFWGESWNRNLHKVCSEQPFAVTQPC